MATFRKRNDPSAIASEGELRVTILCCTNFSEENTFIGCRRKRYRVQVGLIVVVRGGSSIDLQSIVQQSTGGIWHARV